MYAGLSGKQKCEMLRKIRREIAARNNIEYLTADCTFTGECPGTCPKCDAEVRYLEYELNRKIQAGQQVMIAGINDDLISLIGQVERAVMDPSAGKENRTVDPFGPGGGFPPMDRIPPLPPLDPDRPVMGNVTNLQDPIGHYPGRNYGIDYPETLDELGLRPELRDLLIQNGIKDAEELCSKKGADILGELVRKEVLRVTEIYEIESKVKSAGLDLY